MSESNPVQPALDALQELRSDVKSRIGKEGGNLNKLMLARINTVEGILLQIPSVQSMVNVITQQAQLMTFTIRNMAKVTPNKQLTEGEPNNGDDNGTSEAEPPAKTKGK